MEVLVPSITEPQEQFDVHIIFTNHSQEAFAVSRVRLELPKALVVGERSKEAASTIPDFDLYSNNSREVMVTIPAVSLLKSPTLIVFSHGQYPIQVLYDYKIANAETQANTRSVSESGPALTLDGPRWAVVLGAAMGYPFFLFLRYLLRRMRGTKPVPTSVPLWIQWVGGWMVVMLSAILFRFTSVNIPQLPVAVQVKDFWGGALLNLAAEPLTTWLAGLIAPSGDVPVANSDSPPARPTSYDVVTPDGGDR